MSAPAAGKLKADDLADRIANISEGYCCDDCGAWVPKGGRHNPQHIVRKQSMIEGWGIAKALAAASESSALAELRANVDEMDKAIHGIRTYKVMHGFRSEYYVPLPQVIATVQRLKIAFDALKAKEGQKPR